MNPSSDKVRNIIGKLIAAETGGRSIPDQRVIARHPDLASELPDALNSLERIRAAEAESIAAGSIALPMKIYTDEELAAPIDFVTVANADLAEPLQSFSRSIVGYEILEHIGQGGQASVYRARKLSTGGTVAIKVLPGGFFATTRARARFDREAKAMVKISHPNVVPVLDRGRTQDGSQFIVMEFVEGLPLDRYLHSTTDAKTVAALFEKIAEAVRELHRCGIVHRDLKPSNVLVDRYGQPRVLDFGLAHIDDAPGVTDTGQVLGSLPWASPEQAAGRLEEVAECSDIYAIGVILAFILDGKAPYPTSGPPLETARHICHTAPRVGDGRSPSTLDQIALKCLAKKPGDRYESARELRDHLHRVVEANDSPVSPRKKSRYQFLVLLATLFTLSALALEFSHFRRRPTVLADSIPQPLIADQVIDLPHFVNSVSMRFNLIPAGTFTMGSPEPETIRYPGEEPRTVKIASPFFLAATETTQLVYQNVMKSNPSDSRFRGADLPVQNVTYENAIEFCDRLGAMERRSYRLPTEEEWEFACRASSDTRILSESNLSKIAWWSGNSGGSLHPVADLSSNRWGLFDMLGGVSEWCALPSQSSTMPVAHGRILAVTKGGSFDTPASFCRSAGRKLTPTMAACFNLGFRVVAVR